MSPTRSSRSFRLERKCLLCENLLGPAIRAEEELGGVTSDIKPWPKFGTLHVCSNCGHVQKDIGPEWSEQAERIYSKYQLNLLTGGEEQKIFIAEGALARSDRILGRLREKISLPSSGTMLDIGCGNGATLRAFGRLFPEWQLSGFERDGRYRDEVLSLSGVEHFQEGDLDRIDESFDCITLVHVLEHLPDPKRALRWIRRHLSPTGVLVIQVPNIAVNAFDLTVFDHASHFDPRRLASFGTAMGFKVIEVGDWIAKEITGVFQNGADLETEMPASGDASEVESRVRADVEWLGHALKTAREVAPLGVFGTAVAGTWLAGRLGNRVQFFVDEDLKRRGKHHMGLPVLSPHDVPKGSNVFIAFPPELASVIQARLAAEFPGWKTVCPWRPIE